MCRWIMYSGEPLLASKLVCNPKNSLITQSIDAKEENHFKVNADGVGFGWYTNIHPEPGLYRDPLPAWSNENFKELCNNIQSPLFFAHVRASTGAASINVNCHPFKYKNMLFMHNGAVMHYNEIKGDLTHHISPELAPFKMGSTDSEMLFYMALSNGLEENPQEAIRQTFQQIIDVQLSKGLPSAVRASIAFSNGETSYAVRFSNTNVIPSLYYIQGKDLPKTIETEKFRYCFRNSVLITSEKLEDILEYKRIPNNMIITLNTKGFFKMENLFDE